MQSHLAWPECFLACLQSFGDYAVKLDQAVEEAGKIKRATFLAKVALDTVMSCHHLSHIYAIACLVHQYPWLSAVSPVALQLLLAWYTNLHACEAHLAKLGCSGPVRLPQCPNQANIYHSCAPYCFDRYVRPLDVSPALTLGVTLVSRPCTLRAQPPTHSTSQQSRMHAWTHRPKPG